MADNANLEVRIRASLNEQAASLKEEWRDRLHWLKEDPASLAVRMEAKAEVISKTFQDIQQSTGEAWRGDTPYKDPTHNIRRQVENAVEFLKIMRIEESDRQMGFRPEEQKIVETYRAARQPEEFSPEGKERAIKISYNENSPDQKPRPASEMSNQEIVSESRQLHDRFETLKQEFQGSNTPAERQSLRSQMQPIVERENELRAEYKGRNGQEIAQDQAPRREAGYGL